MVFVAGIFFTGAGLLKDGVYLILPLFKAFIHVLIHCVNELAHVIAAVIFYFKYTNNFNHVFF